MKRILLLLVCSCFLPRTYATHVTGFSGFYQNGQVFFTWNLISPDSAFYKLYRSPVPIITGAQLSTCEYLGITNQASAVNNNLTYADAGVKSFWIIEPGGSPLDSTKGLFVVTCVENTSNYYALTTVVGGVEDTTISQPKNSLEIPIDETISEPQPILQEIRTISNNPAEIYGDFMSSRNTLNGPLRLKKTGWLGYDFAIFRNDGTPGPHPIRFRFHPGGNNFLNKITAPATNEIIVGLEDYFPDAELNSGWIGTHETYDPYSEDNDSVPPDTGVNYFYTQERLLKSINWIFKNFDVDTNRIYMEGTSFGAYGTFFFAMAYPEKIAAIDLTVGMFDLGFENDWMDTCTMNVGRRNRIDESNKYGDVPENLQVANTGLGVYTILNGGRTVHVHNELNYPVIYSINGRNDQALGWTEKTIWYDSVNANHVGGYYFFDERDHSGVGKAWAHNFDFYRYARNVSYPAFSNCSVNNNAGNGSGLDGDSVGTINGFMDWGNNIIDDTTQWSIDISMRDLKRQNGIVVVAADSCLTDISPRRLQKFHPQAGDNLIYTVTYGSEIIQSGWQPYSGGLITIPHVKIMKDTVIFQIMSGTGVPDTFYLDMDQDGYGGDSVSVIAFSAPAGYSATNDDCNDHDINFSPLVAETCNSLDDNCNGSIDEGLMLTYYYDGDLDQFGLNTDSISTCGTPPLHYILNGEDCDDTNASIFPGAAEVCNALDDDCNNQVDDGLVFTSWYQDADNDQFGNEDSSVSTCNGAPLNYVGDHSDCDDTNPLVYPGASEIQNGIDDDCDGDIDEFSDGIEDADNAFSISMFPNPASKFFTIYITENSGNAEDAIITITDLPGRIIYEKTSHLLDGELNEIIPLDQNLSSGMFLVKVQIGKRRVTSPLIIN